MVKKMEKSATTVFIEKIGLKSGEIYTWSEIESKAEVKGISSQDAEKYIYKAREEGKIIRYTGLVA